MRTNVCAWTKGRGAAAGVCLLTLAVGCGRPAAEKTSAAAADDDINPVAEVLTQRTAIRTGRRAADKVKAINTQRNKEIEDSLDQ